MAQRIATSQAKPVQSRWEKLWIALIWARVLVGVGMTPIAGVAFGYACTREFAAPWWCVGGITFLLGLLLAVSGFRGFYASLRQPKPQAPTPANDREPWVPMVGALLIYKYQLITEGQLEKALQRQSRQRRNKRLLGDILIEMGLITKAQLQQALDYQRSCSRRDR